MEQELLDFIDELYPTYKALKGDDRIAKDEWTIFAQQGLLFVDYMTGGRVMNAVICNQHKLHIGYAVIDVVDVELDYQQRKRLLVNADKGALLKGVKSESVKSHSKTYDITTADTLSTWEQDNHREKVSLVKRHLLTTGLLYRGL